MPASTHRTNSQIALDALSTHLDTHPLEFVISAGDLVTAVTRTSRGTSSDAHDFFAFHTLRIVSGEVVEHWANVSLDDPPLIGHPGALRAPVTTPGAGDPMRNTRTVADFYRVVFDGQNADAVAAFVAEDYHQHSRHMPEGRAGLETFVRGLFPDGPVEEPANASLPPTILMGEGDLVVIAAAMPQPDAAADAPPRMLYDGYRLRDGLLTEHWSGVDTRPPAEE